MAILKTGETRRIEVCQETRPLVTVTAKSNQTVMDELLTAASGLTGAFRTTASLPFTEAHMLL